MCHLFPPEFTRPALWEGLTYFLSPLQNSRALWEGLTYLFFLLQSLPNLTLTLPCGKALYSYEGKEPGDLQFAKGDIIILRRKVDDNWYHGELNSCHGFLPASYIALLRPLSQTPPTGKALYDFEVKDKDQDKDCLAFSKVHTHTCTHTQTYTQEHTLTHCNPLCVYL